MSFTPPFLPRIGSYEYPAPGTVQIRSMTDLPLSGQQFALLSSKFELHKIALRSSLADYVVANGELADGTRYRIISNGPQHIISAWPVPGGGTVFIPRIYSGIVRDGQIVDVDGKHVLRDFQPTAQCWQYPLAKSTAVPTGAFSDIKALAVAPDGSSSLGDSKFTPSQASMYSGLMAKVVQVVLGFGQQDATAGLTTHVKYAW